MGSEGCEFDGIGAHVIHYALRTNTRYFVRARRRVPRRACALSSAPSSASASASRLLGAHRLLGEHHTEAGELLAHHRRCGAADARDHERRALSIFMEPMAHHVAADVPEPPRGGEKALDMAARHEGFLRASIPGCSSASHHSSAAFGSTTSVCDYTGGGTSWWGTG